MVCKGRIMDSAEKTVGLIDIVPDLQLLVKYIVCPIYKLVIEWCLCQIVYQTKVSPYWGNNLPGSFLIRGQHSNRDLKQHGVMYVTIFSLLCTISHPSYLLFLSLWTIPITMDHWSLHMTNMLTHPYLRTLFHLPNPMPCLPNRPQFSL